jgi:hypothetical protein
MPPRPGRPARDGRRPCESARHRRELARRGARVRIHADTPTSRYARIRRRTVAARPHRVIDVWSRAPALSRPNNGVRILHPTRRTEHPTRLIQDQTEHQTRWMQHQTRRMERQTRWTGHQTRRAEHPRERAYAGPKVLPVRRCGWVVRGIRVGATMVDRYNRLFCRGFGVIRPHAE